MPVGVMAAGTGRELMLEAVHKGVVGVAASEVRHGADGLRLLVHMSCVVVDPVVWYPGRWLPW